MDNNNWRPNQGTEAGMDISDWRVRVRYESRQRIVDKITDTLKGFLLLDPIHTPERLHQLRMTAQRYEERIFITAESKVDYLRQISMKMVMMTQSQTTVAPYFPPNQGINNVEDIPKEAICRICLVELGGANTLKMECSCKGELAFLHRECAVKWFKIKGNRTCDVCNQVVKNLHFRHVYKY